ncbi:MAG TPA: hypothetical protein VET69_11075 [Terriglobales bacterium]|nr:hypothetical protein [Terriglobales bacterium]
MRKLLETMSSALGAKTHEYISLERGCRNALMYRGAIQTRSPPRRREQLNAECAENFNSLTTGLVPATVYQAEIFQRSLR